jgi:diacylglycerol kinase
LKKDAKWRPGKWKRSLRYAYEGIQYALSTQPNMKFHFFAAFVVLTAALFVHLSKTDILFILLAVTLMIVTELINTAVEKAVDLAMPDRHPLAKIAKDVAAASVLVSAVFAVIVGMIVFYDPIDRLFHQAREHDRWSAGTIWIFLSLVMLSVIVVATRFSEQGKPPRPSLFTAVAFAISTLMTLFAKTTLVALCAFTLSVLITIILYEKKSRAFAALLLGALLGCAVTVLGYLLMNLSL